MQDDQSLLEYEEELWSEGLLRIAGIDEAGRGPLAGPVVACAVVLDPDFAREGLKGELNGLTDSKQLTEARREHFFDILTRSSGVEYSLGEASPEEIDKINILQATYLAMARAVNGLKTLPQHVLVDGNPVQGLPCESTAIVKGDSRSLSIASASIIAKVTRDRVMLELHKRYPVYGFDAHKGYGSKRHIQALLEHGPSPVHRVSFRPVREAGGIKDRKLEGKGSAGQLELGMDQ